MPTRTIGPGPAAAGADSETRARDEPEPRPRPRGGRAVDEGDAFDLWLRRGLRRAFDAVAAEPVPDDLLRMIEEDRGERDRIRRGRVRGRGA